MAVAMAVVVAFRGSGVRRVDAALDAFFVLTNQFGLTKRTGPVRLVGAPLNRKNDPACHSR